MIDEMTHEIVDVYLIRCEKGNLALCYIESEKDLYIEKAKKKGITVTIQKITTNVTRANQIGMNLFHVNYPVKTKDELIEFRNTVISEWIHKCDTVKNCNKDHIWKMVAGSFQIPFETPEGFSQSIIDKIEFI